MSKPVEFDDMIDVAFAEIYFDACTMEREGRIDPENTTEEFARDCKQLAADYCEEYKKACEEGEPSFYDDLYPWAEKKLIEMYPYKRKFTVLIDANLTMKREVMATSEDEAREIAQSFIDSKGFERVFKQESYIYETTIDEVIDSKEE